VRRQIQFGFNSAIAHFRDGSRTFADELATAGEGEAAESVKATDIRS
jgi:hypothetical protein